MNETPSTPSPAPKLTKGQARASAFLSWVFIGLFLAAVVGVAAPAVHGVWTFWRDVFTTKSSYNLQVHLDGPDNFWALSRFQFGSQKELKNPARHDTWDWPIRE